QLDNPQEHGRIPPVLLRRMKVDNLEGLPDRHIARERVIMPPDQAKTYGDAVRQAQTGGSSRGDMIQAIHAFRGISLHPDGARECDPLDPNSVRRWFNRSARVRHAVEVLETLRTSNE